MKEQIRDLEKQSGIDVYSLGLDRAKWESKLEKFAELIIQKCITQISLIGVSNFENEHIMWTVETAIDSIKEHFGVK